VGLRVHGRSLGKEELKMMDKHRGKTGDKVFFANTLEEAKRIEFMYVKRTIKCMLLRAFIWVWLICANSVLRILQLILFRYHFGGQIKIDNIIVYTVGTLGDNVLLLPAIKSIKDKYGNTQLTVITNCNGFSSVPSEEIFGNVPYVDKVITIPDHPVQRRGLQIRLEPVELKNNNCDLFVNLSPFGNRGWIGAVVREMIFAKWLGAKWAVGFKMSTYSRSNFFNKVQHHFVENEARRCRSILKELGLNTIENKDLLPVNREAKNRVLNLLSTYPVAQSPLVVLIPGAKLNASHWPAERFGMVAAWLVKTYNACVVLNGIECEKQICDNVLRASDEVAINMAGKLSVQELIELLRMSSLCVTNNTGPMTLAAMIGVPMVVISSTRFSPTFYFPFSRRMIWLFAFSKNSYSYNDEGGTSQDLMVIDVPDVIKAIKQVHQFGS
jgi:heptosyltransferase-3